MRFKDPTLTRIMQAMRVPGGQPLPGSECRALLATELDNDSPSAAKPDVAGWYHTSYVWSVIAMATSVEARESARIAQKTLFYIQAVDLPVNLGAASDTDTQKLYHAFLRVSSLTKTKRLPAFSLLHVGMEVRLTTTLEMPYAVQDATATVLEIHFANNEDQVVQRRSTGAVLESLPPEILLASLPVAILVKLHDCEHVFCQISIAIPAPSIVQHARRA